MVRLSHSPRRLVVLGSPDRKSCFLPAIGHHWLAWCKQLVGLTSYDARSAAVPSGGITVCQAPRATDVEWQAERPTLAVPREGRLDVPSHFQNTSFGMSPRSYDQIPLRLRRCAMCGHPSQEHRGTLGCTVPRCECDEFADTDLHPSGQKSSP